jgi:hypothetical protein
MPPTQPDGLGVVLKGGAGESVSLPSLPVFAHAFMKGAVERLAVRVLARRLRPDGSKRALHWPACRRDSRAGNAFWACGK